MSPPTPHEMQFVHYLASLVEREDRGALADLRRGLGKEPGTAAEMFPYVVPFAPERDENRFYLIASLFALHPSPSPTDGGRRRNLGAALQWVKSATGSESIELRFVALLNRPLRDLPDHLRHAVSLCKAHDVPIDWAQLLHDLRYWDAPSHSIQRDWARAFWGAPSEVPPDPETARAGSV